MAVPSRPAPIPKPAQEDSLLGAIRSPEPSGTGGAVTIFAEPTPRFWLMQPPDGWEIGEVHGEVEVDGKAVKLDGVYMLPQLVARPEVPGSMPGLRTLRRGEPESAAFADALRRARDDGWTVLDRDQRIASVYLPAGLPEGPYVRFLPCVSVARVAGLRHFEAWDVPIRVPPGTPQRFRRDWSSYNLWRSALVLAGRFPEPTEFALDTLRSVAGQRLNRIQTTNYASPELRTLRVEQAKAIKKAVDTAGLPGAS